MAKNETVSTWLKNRVGMVTQRGSNRELLDGDFAGQLNTHAFVSAGIFEAELQDQVRAVTDAMSAGELSFHDAKEKLRNLDGALKSRAEFILRTQRQMAQAVGEYKAMYDPDVLEMFPYLKYHSESDGFVRPAHKALDGLVFDKDDPFVQTHWAGSWDYNCRCYWEELTRKQVEGGKIEKPKPAEFDPDTTFRFNPAEAFEANDIGYLEPKTRDRILRDISGAVKDGRLNKVGLLVSGAAKPIPKADLSGLDDLRSSLEKVRPAAEQSVRNAGLDPAKMPDYKGQADAYGTRPDKNVLPPEIRENWRDATLGKLSPDAAAAVGEKELEIRMEAGNKAFGLRHNWIHHKEGFANPDQMMKMLKATLGNPKASLVVSMNSKAGGVEKKIVFHDPRTGSYCVCAVLDGKLQIMSVHRASRQYGQSQWSY